MCELCCGSPEDDHGDDRNIKWSQVEAAAAANNQSPAETVQHVMEMAVDRASDAE